MTGLSYRKSWTGDMGDETRNEHSPLKTDMMSKEIVHMCESRSFSLHLLSVTRETPLFILSGVLDESETNIV
ncbi:hypothetical protein HF325_006185 [Metschnikowia pulcherrima]|uniref:Uncharacterized protein n=1 Tax=Metschnikowia pulcherrima TaxID=27326 RepID=A0A8H7GNC8_9ASCO|nr:hypothetical protein HF325_006185 [Metschnikowia pulcherrima]